MPVPYARDSEIPGQASESTVPVTTIAASEGPECTCQPGPGPGPGPPGAVRKAVERMGDPPRAYAVDRGPHFAAPWRVPVTARARVLSVPPLASLSAPV